MANIDICLIIYVIIDNLLVVYIVIKVYK